MSIALYGHALYQTSVGLGVVAGSQPMMSLILHLIYTRGCMYLVQFQMVV